jgi:RNA polymerase sigma factor (sigma-70 family)
MAALEETTGEIQSWLDRLQSGHDAARDEVINHSCERLRKLARRMLRGYPRLRRWETTDDVLQNAMLRLHRSMAGVKPETTRDYLGLAATQIRRTLLDLTRHHFGPEGAGGNHHTDGNDDEPAHQRATTQPENLDEWSALHEAVEALPDEEREVVGLLWYEGLTQIQAAHVLGVNERTIRRRWLSARCRLHDALDGDPPI